MPKLNPTMLMIARESRGITQSALADVIHVAQGTLSKAETGVQPPPGDLIEKYAAALRYPVSFFHQELDARNLPVTFFRKSQSLGKLEIRRITALANVRRLHLRGLTKSIDLRTPKKLPQVDLRDYRNAPEAVAKELRIAWNLPPGPVKNMTRTLEDAGVVVLRFDFGNDRISGLGLYDSADPDQIPPVVLVNQVIPCDRWRFTLVHELAHIVLHNHLTLPPMECEDEADAFASEFLMPSTDIKSDLANLTLPRLAELKAYWRVSIGALIQKAHALGRVNDYQRKRLYQQLAMAGYSRTSEPVKLEPEEPALIKEMVQCHMEDLGYDETHLRGLVHLEPEELRATYGVSPPGLRLVQ